ncbi:DUF3291 domain-containing protein [Ktedonosporobacter rubrisoli]|uniref:DUF3291 domain-containing protein n=1 Tax=Ktedonosporobacter rubrisoli TaxID=2509675 RepID=A0A4P6JI79_KTERU|nr:DUF3291 domain-containing protein [Ktedonosporobacter rubrisoli]QBD74759.1 DUF3291 domain-containing protein [Ktedonosporobacter rubrisoli]
MYHIAQVNVAYTLAPLNDPLLADFAAKLDPIYALAEESPGFIWRPKAELFTAAEAAHLPVDERLFATISVWSSLEALKAFVYKSEHAQVMRRRREWFKRLQGPYVALWWVPEGHRPGLAEVKERMEYLRAHGPSSFAFTFAQPFPAPDLLSGTAREATKSN